MNLGTLVGQLLGFDHMTSSEDRLMSLVTCALTQVGRNGRWSVGGRRVILTGVYVPPGTSLVVIVGPEPVGV